MKCEERQDAIALLACGALEGVEREELLRHLDRGCPRCAGVRAESEATFAHLALALEPVAPPAHLRDALLERVQRVPRPALVPRAARSEPAAPRSAWARPLVAAALAAVLTGVALFVPTRRTVRALEAQIAGRDESLARLDARLRTLEQQQREAVETASFLGAATTAIYRLGPTGTQPGAEARVFMDPRLRRAQLVASNLASPGPGRTYELWFIEAGGRKIPAGTFDVDASGAGTLSAQIPADAAEIAVLAITDEPAGGSTEPTGQVHLAGNIQASS